MRAALGTATPLGMRRRLALAAVPLLGIAYVLLAGVLGRVHVASPTFARLTRSELIHIPAHLVLYGTLAWVGLCAGLGPRGAAIAAMAIACAQELAQDLGFRRAPGWPELFDLGVDAVAVAATIALATRQSARRVAGR
jgi:hypothetical protein